MGKFIGYRIGVDDEGTPIATGATREEAQSKAIRRVLSIADVHSSIGTREVPDLTDDEFASLTQITDEWAAEAVAVVEIEPGFVRVTHEALTAPVVVGAVRLGDVVGKDAA